MRIAEMLQAIASWLESPNNEALLLAEQNDECMKVVAESCTLAAELLKNAATEVDQLEPVESALNSDSIEEIAALASAFDASGDPGLKKQASVLDELLMSIAAPPNAFAERKDLLENRLVALKHKYENPTKVLSEANGLDAAKKVLEKSDMVKEYRPNEFALSTRYCPQHPGTSWVRVGQDLVQCPLDKKIYNYATGYTLDNGDKVPGGDVSEQTKGLNPEFHNLFDTREGRLGYNK